MPLRLYPSVQGFPFSKKKGSGTGLGYRFLQNLRFRDWRLSMAFRFVSENVHSIILHQCTHILSEL